MQGQYRAGSLGPLVGLSETSRNLLSTSNALQVPIFGGPTLNMLSTVGLSACNVHMVKPWMGISCQSVADGLE